MNFTKSLIIKSAGGCRNRHGQSAVEYFLLLAVILAVTAISSQIFWPTIRDGLQGNFFPKAAERIEKADLN